MLAILATRSFANLPESPGEYSKWEAQMLSAIDNQKNRPPTEAIPKLGSWVMQMSIPSNLEHGNRPVFHAAQADLISIPGHAEYYRDRILEAQERLKNSGGGTTWYDYHQVTRNAFQIFPHLHSPEGVRALGELMSNDWALPGNDTKAISERVPILSESATVALSRFPLAEKPFNDRITKKLRECTCRVAALV